MTLSGFGRWRVCRFFQFGERGDLQRVVVAPELAAPEHRVGDLLEREVRPGGGIAEPRVAEDQKRPLGTDLFAEPRKLRGVQRLCGDVDEVALGGATVLLEHFGMRVEAEALELA